MFLFAAAMTAATACTNDGTADVKGITGDFVYIVGGTEALYHATECSIFRTPDGSEGTIAMDIEFALTKAQNSDVVFTISHDDSMLGGEYDAIPDDILNYSREVTIPAGEKSVTVPVTIAMNNYARFDAAAAPSPVRYMAPFRIATANGAKVSTNSNGAYLIVDSYLVDPSENQISLNSATATFNITHYTDQTRGDAISQRVTITGSADEGAYKEFTAKLAVNNSLIAAYNSTNNTNYQALPTAVQNAITGLEITMPANGKSVQGTIAIPDSAWAQLTDDNGYLVPIVLSDVGHQSIHPTSGTVYLVIKVSHITGSADFFSALYLGDYRMATWYQFQKPIDCGVDDGYTIIMHIFIDEVTNTARIGDWADIDEDWINMLRFGQYGQGNTILDWFVGPNGARKNVRSKEALPTKQWIQLAFVYDNGMYGETPGFYLYVDGVLNNSVTLSEADQAAIARSKKPTFKFQAIEFNSSWGANYRNGNEFHGRLWQVAVFPSVLSGYLNSYLHRDNLNNYAAAVIRSWLNNQGAYWPMNEGTGYILNETTGYYESINFKNTIRCDNEVSMVPADVSAYVQWKNDEYNKFD